MQALRIEENLQGADLARGVERGDTLLEQSERILNLLLCALHAVLERRDALVQRIDVAGRGVDLLLYGADLLGEQSLNGFLVGFLGFQRGNFVFEVFLLLCERLLLGFNVLDGGRVAQRRGSEQQRGKRQCGQPREPLMKMLHGRSSFQR